MSDIDFSTNSPQNHRVPIQISKLGNSSSDVGGSNGSQNSGSNSSHIHTQTHPANISMNLGDFNDSHI
jgi:hypothetical protein